MWLARPDPSFERYGKVGCLLRHSAYKNGRILRPPTRQTSNHLWSESKATTITLTVSIDPHHLSHSNTNAMSAASHAERFHTHDTFAMYDHGRVADPQELGQSPKARKHWWSLKDKKPSPDEQIHSICGDCYASWHCSQAQKKRPEVFTTNLKDRRMKI